MRDLIVMLGYPLTITFMTWSIVATLLEHKIARNDTLEWIFLVLKWPAAVIIPLGWLAGVLDPISNPILNGIWAVYCSWMWWRYRNAGDDDFRKRQRDRLAGKVASIGHRLVITPGNA